MWKNKYHAQKMYLDGIEFDSKHEAQRYIELSAMERAGEIQDLMRQVKFVLIPKQYYAGKVVERECSYYADFTYIKDGKMVVEDAKGVKTPEYVIKRKLMLEKYGIRVQEV